MAYEKLELLINGKFTSGTSGKTEAVINPATEEVLGHLPLASTADLDEAISAPNAPDKEPGADSVAIGGDKDGVMVDEFGLPKIPNAQ